MRVRDFNLRVNIKAQYIRKKIHSLSNATGSEPRLMCLLYILSLFNHLLKYQGSDKVEVEKLTALAMNILSVERIDIRKSKFSYFYWDLYYFSSQLTPGLIESVWNRELGSYLVGKLPQIRIVFDNLFKAEYNVNLGNFEISMSLYNKIEDDIKKLELEANHFIYSKLYLGYMRVNRISGNLNEATRYIEIAENTDFTEIVLREVYWEKALCDIQYNTENGSMAIVKMVQKIPLIFTLSTC